VATADALDPLEAELHAVLGGGPPAPAPERPAAPVRPATTAAAAPPPAAAPKVPGVGSPVAPPAPQTPAGFRRAGSTPLSPPGTVRPAGSSHLRTPSSSAATGVPAAGESAGDVWAVSAVRRPGVRVPKAAVAAALAVVLAVVAAVFVLRSGNGVDQSVVALPADQLLARAVADANGRGWTHITQTLTGAQAITISQDSGPSLGRQVMDGSGMHAVTLLVGSRVYFQADAKALSVSNLPGVDTASLAGRWLYLSPGDAGYETISKGMTLASLLNGFKLVAPFTKSAVATRDGQQVVAVTGEPTAAPDLSGTMYVSVTSEPLPVEFDVASGASAVRVVFSSWGNPVAVSAPSGAVPAGLSSAAASHASPAGPQYGPPGGQFTAAFPTPPRQAADTPSLLGQAPAGSHVWGYWVSPDTGDIFANSAPVPHPPTYVVLVDRLPSAAAVNAFMAQATQVPGLNPVTVDGLKGYEFLGTENNALNQGNTLTDPNAAEGDLIVSNGSVVYMVTAITATAPETARFLMSFRPAA